MAPTGALHTYNNVDNKSTPATNTLFTRFAFSSVFRGKYRNFPFYCTIYFQPTLDGSSGGQHHLLSLSPLSRPPSDMRRWWWSVSADDTLH